MSRLLDDDQDLLERNDRELTLSTGAILAIFLGLVLLCALFFGFGYNLGRKSTAPVPLASTTESAPDSGSASPASTFNDFKTSPSSPAAPASAPASAPAPVAAPTVSVPASPAALAPTPAAAPAPERHAPTAKPHQPPPTPTASPIASHTSATTPAPAHVAVPVAPAAVPKGAFVVQVAAVSRKDDAALLLSALRTRGYTPVARLSPQDKLIHIQVGPFTTRTDAEAMRERLVIDGYNAIVK